MKRKPIWVGLCVVSFGLGCHREAVDDGAAVPVKAVRCAPIVSELVSRPLEVRGTLAPLPDRDALVAAQVAGRLLRVLVREGDAVKVDQEIARVEAATLRDQARQAQAQLARVQAEATLAATTEARTRRIVERGIAARQELDDATAKLATAQAALADARAAAEIAQRQVDRAIVRSPLGGVVLKVMRRTGELVDGTPNTAVVEVGDPSQLELVGAATAGDLVLLAVNAPARISFAALSDRDFAAHVAAVAPAVDRATGLGVVRVALNPLPASSLRPPVGISGVAAIRSGPTHNALIVPAQALRAPHGDEAELVVCGDDGHAHVINVRTSLARPGRLAISAVETTNADLRAGQLVVIDPVLGVADGDAIQVHAQDAAGQVP